MKKKFLIFSVIVTIIFSCLPYGLASEDLLTRDKAVQAIEEKLDLDVPSNTRLELRPDYKYQGKKIWDINWSEPLEDGKGEKYYFVTLDSSANINSYYCLDPVSETKDLTKSITRKEARKKALEFLNKIAPSKLSQIREKPQLITYNSGIKDLSYKFEFERLVEDIPFHDNIISIETYADGNIKSYVIDWDNDINFQESKNIISKKKAENLFKDNMSMILNYSHNFTEKSEKNFLQSDLPVKLVYSPFFKKSSLLEANTGKFINSIGEYIANDKKLHQVAKNKNINEIENQPITKAEALSKVKKLVKYDMFAEGEKSYSESYLDSAQDYVKFDFTRTQKGEGVFRSWVYANAVVNLGTGQIIYLKVNYVDTLSVLSNATKELSSDVKPISWKDGLQLATDFAEKVAPEQFKNTYLICNESEETLEPEQSRQYYYQFGRIVNGIPFDDDGFHIIVDSFTKDILGFKYSWDDKEFPEPKNLVSERKAKKALDKYLDIELSYLRSASNPKQAILVYTVKTPNFMIDAKTGKGHSPYMDTSKEDMLSKIKDSRAEKELSILINQGVIPETRNFDPEKPITRGKFIKLIYETKIKDLPENLPRIVIPSFKDVWKDSPYFYYVETAVRDGIIPKKNKFYPERKLTREDLAVILINLIDCGEVASFNDIYKLQVKDADKISEKKIGAVTLAMAFDIIEPKDGEFHPDDYATWEDVAYGIVRAASKIKR